MQGGGQSTDECGDGAIGLALRHHHSCAGRKGLEEGATSRRETSSETGTHLAERIVVEAARQDRHGGLELFKGQHSVAEWGNGSR